MTVFVDTSGLGAVLGRDDGNRGRARAASAEPPVLDQVTHGHLPGGLLSLPK